MSTNYALASQGSTATAGSQITGYEASHAIDGDNVYGNGSWTAAGLSNIVVDFGQSRNVSQIDVVGTRDAYSSTTEPTLTETFTVYSPTGFTIDYWTGSAWISAVSPVTGNNLVWRQFTGLSITTTKIRVTVTASSDGASRIAEVKAWGDPPDTTAPTVPGVPTYSGVGSTFYTVNWTASTDAVGVTGYDLQKSTDSAFTSPTTYNLGNVTSYSATGLTASTTYYWKVRAHDAVPNNSAYSSSSSQATAAPGSSTFTYNGIQIPEYYFPSKYDWEKVTRNHEYEDAGQSFNKLNTTAPRWWEIHYAPVDRDTTGITFDTHFNTYGFDAPFTYVGKEGTFTNCRYKSYEMEYATKPNLSQYWRLKIVIIRYP